MCWIVAANVACMRLHSSIELLLCRTTLNVALRRWQALPLPLLVAHSGRSYCDLVHLARRVAGGADLRGDGCGCGVSAWTAALSSEKPPATSHMAEGEAEL
jgi:hypothetical protein